MNMYQELCEEMRFTDDRIYVQGKIIAKGKEKCADYIQYYVPNTENYRSQDSHKDGIFFD